MADSDQDGRSDGIELIQRTDPKVADDAAPVSAASLDGLEPTGDDDADSLSNEYEVQHGLDPRLADTDQDQLTDAAEMALGTNPLSIDSDLDGITDHAEVKFGSDPLGTETPEAAVPGLDPSDDIDPAYSAMARAWQRQPSRTPTGPGPPASLRTRLLAPLIENDAPGVVVVIAPPGSGKTTLLARAAARSRRPAAWLTAGPDQRSGPEFVQRLASVAADALGTDLGRPETASSWGPRSRHCRTGRCCWSWTTCTSWRAMPPRRSWPTWCGCGRATSGSPSAPGGRCLRTRPG